MKNRRNRRNGRYAALLLALTLMLAPALLAGCVFVTDTPNRLTSERDVKQAFLEQYVQDTSYSAADLLVEYVGRYDGYDAVYVHGVLDYTQAYDQEIVGEVIFRYPTGQHLLIFSHVDGKLYTLKEALGNEVLDETGLQKVYRAHRAAEPLMYEDIEEDEPSKGESASEGSATEAATEVSDMDILWAFLDRYQPDCDIEELSVARIGEFDGCVAVFVNGPFLYNNVITTQTVDGLEFVYGSSHTMDIYRDGEIYKLQEAWEEGVISRAALRELHAAFSDEAGGNVKE